MKDFELLVIHPERHNVFLLVCLGKRLQYGNQRHNAERKSQKAVNATYSLSEDKLIGTLLFTLSLNYE
jgi:hypothetical protein